MRLRNYSVKNVMLERNTRLPFEGILVVSHPSSTCFSMTRRAIDLYRVGEIRRSEAHNSKRTSLRSLQILARTEQSQQYRMATQSPVPFYHLLLHRYRQRIQEHIPNPHCQNRLPSTRLNNLGKDTSLRRRNPICNAGLRCRQISPDRALCPLLPQG